MRLHIIRHADPDYETDTLTVNGQKEAEALAKRFVSHGLDRIYTSPMGRAVETMKYTAEALNMDYGIEEWTRELWPDLVMKESPWGNVMTINIPGEVLRSDEKIISHKTWHEFKYIKEIDVISIYNNLINHSDEFLERHGYKRIGMRYKCISPNEDQIAIFCHGGFALTWLAHLLEIPPTLMWAGFWLPPSSVTTILFEERSSEWAVPRCLGMADVSHLYEAGLPVSTKGLNSNYY